MRLLRGYTSTAGGGLAGAQILRPDLLDVDTRVVVTTYDGALREHGSVIGKSVGNYPVVGLDSGREVRSLPLFEELEAPERVIPDIVEGGRSTSAVLAFSSFVDVYRRLNWLRSECRAFPSAENRLNAAAVLENCQKRLPALNRWREQHPDVPLELLTRHEAPVWRTPLNMLMRLSNLDLGEGRVAGWHERGWLQALPWRYATCFRPGDRVLIPRWNGQGLTREEATLIRIEVAQEAGILEIGKSVWLFHCEPVNGWRLPDWPVQLSFMELMHELVPAHLRLEPRHSVQDEVVEQYLRSRSLPYKLVKRSEAYRSLVRTDSDLPLDRQRLSEAFGSAVASSSGFRVEELRISGQQNQLALATLMAIRLRWEGVPLNSVWEQYLNRQREQLRDQRSARREAQPPSPTPTVEQMREPGSSPPANQATPQFQRDRQDIIQPLF